MYAITLLRDGPQYRKLSPRPNATIQKLNSTLGFSKHILLNKPFINTACMHILWT